jgi:hypothetical protein
MEICNIAMPIAYVGSVSATVVTGMSRCESDSKRHDGDQPSSQAAEADVLKSHSDRMNAV